MIRPFQPVVLALATLLVIPMSGAEAKRVDPWIGLDGDEQALLWGEIAQPGKTLDRWAALMADAGLGEGDTQAARLTHMRFLMRTVVSQSFSLSDPDVRWDRPLRFLWSKGGFMTSVELASGATLPASWTKDGDIWTGEIYRAPAWLRQRGQRVVVAIGKSDPLAERADAAFAFFVGAAAKTTRLRVSVAQALPFLIAHVPEDQAQGSKALEAMVGMLSTIDLRLSLGKAGLTVNGTFVSPPGESETARVGRGLPVGLLDHLPKDTTMLMLSDAVGDWGLEHLSDLVAEGGKPLFKLVTGLAWAYSDSGSFALVTVTDGPAAAEALKSMVQHMATSTEFKTTLKRHDLAGKAAWELHTEIEASPEPTESAQMIHADRWHTVGGTDSVERLTRWTAGKLGRFVAPRDLRRAIKRLRKKASLLFWADGSVVNVPGVSVLGWFGKTDSMHLDVPRKLLVGALGMLVKANKAPHEAVTLIAEIERKVCACKDITCAKEAMVELQSIFKRLADVKVTTRDQATIESSVRRASQCAKAFTAD